MADSTPSGETTPEPAFKWGLVVPIIMSIQSTAVALAVAFSDWRPTTEQLAALASIETPLALIIGFFAAWRVRQQVTPTVNVALTKRDVEALDVAQAAFAPFESAAKPRGVLNAEAG